MLALLHDLSVKWQCTSLERSYVLEFQIKYIARDLTLHISPLQGLCSDMTGAARPAKKKEEGGICQEILDCYYSSWNRSKYRKIGNKLDLQVIHAAIWHRNGNFYTG